MTNRTRTVINKVKTQFGSMYIHIEYDDKGRTVGAWISDPGKEPHSQIALLVETLSIALNKALKGEE